MLKLSLCKVPHFKNNFHCFNYCVKYHTSKATINQCVKYYTSKATINPCVKDHTSKATINQCIKYHTLKTTFNHCVKYLTSKITFNHCVKYHTSKATINHCVKYHTSKATINQCVKYHTSKATINQCAKYHTSKNSYHVDHHAHTLCLGLVVVNRSTHPALWALTSVHSLWHHGEWWAGAVSTTSTGLQSNRYVNCYTTTKVLSPSLHNTVISTTILISVI